MSLLLSNSIKKEILKARLKKRRDAKPVEGGIMFPVDALVVYPRLIEYRYYGRKVASYVPSITLKPNDTLTLHLHGNAELLPEPVVVCIGSSLDKVGVYKCPITGNVKVSVFI